MNNTTKQCSPRNTCDNFRDCDYCARIRQAKIADATERLQGLCGELDWTILYPHESGKAGIDAVKAQFIKKAKPEGAIWTVEQSTKSKNLHLNIITPANQIAQLSEAERWSRRIEGCVRNVGAYIAKREQMPNRKDYDGKLFGTAGSLWQVLVTQRESAVVAAAAAQYAINSQAMIDQAARKHYEQQKKPEKRVFYTGKKEEMTREQSREIATKWLPDILKNQREAELLRRK